MAKFFSKNIYLRKNEIHLHQKLTRIANEYADRGVTIGSYPIMGHRFNQIFKNIGNFTQNLVTIKLDWALIRTTRKRGKPWWMIWAGNLEVKLSYWLTQIWEEKKISFLIFFRMDFGLW
jgi:hypothetical protein